MFFQCLELISSPVDPVFRTSNDPWSPRRGHSPVASIDGPFWSHKGMSCHVFSYRSLRAECAGVQELISSPLKTGEVHEQHMLWIGVPTFVHLLRLRQTLQLFRSLN